MLMEDRLRIVDGPDTEFCLAISSDRKQVTLSGSFIEKVCKANGFLSTSIFILYGEDGLSVFEEPDNARD